MKDKEVGLKMKESNSDSVASSLIPALTSTQRH
jgi:hypothetical protein